MTQKLSPTQTESLKSIYNLILSFIPGGIFTQELVDLKGRIQQERLNKFSEWLKESFEKITGKTFDPKNLKSENFLDAFEVIVRKVAQTKSEEKLNSYKNVLLRQMFEPNDSEMFAKYLALIDDVSETQILILSSFKHGSANKISDIAGYLVNPNSKMAYLVNMITRDDIKLFNGSLMKWDELKFYIYDLRSKGMLDQFSDQEIQHGSKVTYINPSNEAFRLSLIGEGFLNFIKEYTE